MSRLLERLALHRPELRGWIFYDWANSAFWATVIQIFPIYYLTYASEGVPGPTAQSRYAWATTLSMAIVAVLSPVLGAIADYAGVKKKMLGAFLLLGVPSTAAMYLAGEGEWLFATIVFVLANIGVAGTIVFYDSLLPHVARPDEIDRVSSAGFAMGYLGSGLLMAVNLAWIQWPERFGIADEASAMRLGFLSAAAWWALFSIPLFLRVSEPPRRLEAGEPARTNPVREGFVRLFATFRELRRYRQAVLMLVAFLIYNDGVGTIIRMAAPYGTEMGLPAEALIGSLLLVQFVGIPCAYGFGWIASRIGPKRAIFLALAVYVAITIVAYSITSMAQFLVLAVLVGMVMGGTQALSRSLFASLIPPHKSAEFFGFFGTFEKFAGIFGPALFATLTQATGSSRTAILAVMVFFIVGGALLALVDVDEGRRVAREAEAEAHPA